MNSSAEFIGTDFVHNFLGETVEENTANPKGSDEKHDSNLSKSLLETVSSPSARRQSQSTNRIILLGPPQSGKSSLLMEHAYSITSSQFVATKTSLVQQRVTLLLHQSHRQQTAFPLPCRRCLSKYQYETFGNDLYEQAGSETEHERASALFQKRMEMVEQDALDEMNCSPEKSGAPFDSKISHAHSDPWNRLPLNKKALEQINIHYISSINDIIRYLSVIPLLSIDKRPNGGLIIDDLHLFFKEDFVKNDDSIDDGLAMRLLQLVALLAKSSNSLDSEKNSCSYLLKTIISWDNTIVPLPQHILQIISNYFPNCITISPQLSQQQEVNSKSFRTIPTGITKISEWKISSTDLGKDAYDHNSKTNNTCDDRMEAEFKIFSSGKMDGNNLQKLGYSELIWFLKNK